MTKKVLGLGLASLAFLAGCQQGNDATPTTPFAEVIRLDEDYGPAPAAGWKWGAALITTEAQEATEDANNHTFAWVFYVLRGSTEVATATQGHVLSAGQATIVPARQAHTHTYPPQSQVLVFRPAERPFGDFHRGARLYESEALPVTAGRNYRIRIREQTVSARSPSTLTTNTGFAYVLEGPLVVRDGAADSVRQTGDAFGLLSPGLVLLTAGATPGRVAVVDLY